MSHVTPSVPSPSAVSSANTNDFMILSQQQQQQQHPRILKVIRHWATLAIRWIIGNATFLHIWPACALPALTCFVVTSLCLWAVISDTSCTTTSVNRRISLNVAAGGLFSALRQERDVTVLVANCSVLKSALQKDTDSRLQVMTNVYMEIVDEYRDNSSDIILLLVNQLNTVRSRCNRQRNDEKSVVTATTTTLRCWLEYNEIIVCLVELLKLCQTKLQKKVGTLSSTTDCYLLHQTLERHEADLMSTATADLSQIRSQGISSLSCDQLQTDTVTSDDLLESAMSLYDISSSRRSAAITVLSFILLLLSTVSPMLCLWYSRTCVAVVTAVDDNLKLIEKKTKELTADTKSIEGILCQLLPPSVAQDLKSNKSVLAESYKSVTIYFSDIVGFTNISASSSPMQIVEFLNKLYTEFDSRIDLYDVYKVETIGDAYVIASGCPRTNGIRHAAEIATLSLDLLNMTHNFQIPHKPDQKLMLRIGLHSGSCLAAVVGDKMPRYCLFGETVSIASRMESTGQALRIQISEDCKNLLDQLGVYIYDDRGQVEIKENEFIKTYWLTGKDGYRFKVDKDVCVFIPKKVKLEKVVVMKKAPTPAATAANKSNGITSAAENSTNGI